LLLNHYPSIITLYENNREAFDKFLDDYIDRTGTIDSIRGAYTNSVVGTRWRIIDEALQAYEAGYKIMFSAVCLSIVEGIVHDICLMAGMTKNDIAGDGFQKKIDKIKSLVGLGLNYEYYVFKFRLIRNKVAHGTAEAEELQDIAGLLLLDLLNVINISTSPRLPSNAKRFFLHQSLEDKSPTNYGYAAGYIILNKYEIPGFYDNVAVDHPKLLLILQEAGFWSYVDSLVDGEDDKKAIAFELLKRLKLLDVPSIKNECTKERFKKVAKTPVVYNQEEYLRLMLQYGY
jgi:hypothetical protein